MKIANSSVAMAAAASFTQKTSKSENLQFWVGNRPRGLPWLEAGHNPVKVDISQMARQLSQDAEFAAPNQGVDGTSESGAGQADGLTEKDKQLLRMLDEFFYRLTGRHFKFRTLDQQSLSKFKSLSAPYRLDISRAQPVQQRAGFGLIYDSTENYSESASMSFATAGKVQTADGRTIGCLWNQ